MPIDRDGRFRIPNPKDSNPKLSESNNRIRFISCLQALSRCLVTDFLFVKASITCSVPNPIIGFGLYPAYKLYHVAWSQISFL